MEVATGYAYPIPNCMPNNPTFCVAQVSRLNSKVKRRYFIQKKQRCVFSL